VTGGLEPPLRDAQLDLDGRESLPDLIVQLTGNGPFYGNDGFS
jgi:hypothetical protein